jgi:two-component system response regulator FixJ
MSKTPEVYVVDDDADVRDSLTFLLGSVGIPAVAFTSGAALLAKVGPQSTGCVVTDVRMPEVSGIDLLRELKRKASDLVTIVITGHGEVALAVEAMKLGAFDFIEKPFDDEQILSAVRQALAQHQKARRQSADHALVEARLTSLSSREREVLEGLVKGKPNKIIAFDLGISPRTVEIYRANVMRKMEANSLSDLVRFAIAGGIMRVD